MRFCNSSEGFDRLLKFIVTRKSADDELRIGMEATGHYWLALFSFLHKQGFSISFINPIQSDSLRNFIIRQTKTDAVDCFLVADVLRFGQYTETHLADEDMVALRNLARFRESMVDTCAEYKLQVIAILDQVFPEYEKLFSDIFDESSKAFLKTYGTPEQCLEANTKSIAALLKKTAEVITAPQKLKNSRLQPSHPADSIWLPMPSPSRSAS